MFGLDLTQSEWAGLVAVAFLFGRVLFAVGRVIWWYVTDARRVTSPHFGVTLLCGVAVATMCVAIVSVATDWPPTGLRLFAYCAAAFGGFLLGIMFDFVISIRLWKVSDWLMSLRVPQYRERLLHGDPAVRQGAVERLAGLGPYARPARPELLAAVRADESADVRATAIQAVWLSTPIPPTDEDADLPKEARAAMGDADPRVRTVAAAILVGFDAARPDEVLPALCDGLKCDDLNTSGCAVVTLEKLGPAAEPAVGALKEAALRPENPNSAAPDALGKIGAPAVPALIEILERGDRSCKWSAADALAEMGEPARAALPALQKVANHPDDIVQNAAKKAIQKLGGHIA
jgi:HEAT repeat protein